MKRKASRANYENSDKVTGLPGNQLCPFHELKAVTSAFRSYVSSHGDGSLAATEFLHLLPAWRRRFEHPDNEG